MSSALFRGDAVSSLWERVEASLRPLEPWERPVYSASQDDRMIVLARDPESDLPVARSLGVYQPLEVPSLLPDFMRLLGGPRLPRAAQVVTFYRSYGALRQRALVNGEESPAWVSRLPEASRRRIVGDARWLEEPAWWVEEKARELHLVYDLYRALLDDDLMSVRSLLGDMPEGTRVDRFAISAGRVVPCVVPSDDAHAEQRRRRAGSAAVPQSAHELPADSPLRPLTDRECRQEGTRLLATQLSDASQRLRLRWSAEPADGADRFALVRVRSFSDLVTAMWLQLGDLIEQGARYPLCRGCGEPFWGHGKQRFCSRQCGDAWRQRHLYRNRDRRSG